MILVREMEKGMQALLYSANSIESNLLKIVLQQSGYLVETTNNLMTAVDRLPERPYDLLLLSMNDEIELTIITGEKNSLSNCDRPGPDQ